MRMEGGFDEKAIMNVREGMPGDLGVLGQTCIVLYCIVLYCIVWRGDSMGNQL